MSSAIKTPAFQAKAGNIQNEDGSSIYSGGEWSLKNSTALTSVTITDAGNVGIGGTPIVPFEIIRNTTSGSAPDYPNIRLNNQNATGYSGFYFYHGSVLKAGLEMKNDVGALLFAVGASGTERMRIDANGSVLVNPSLTHNATPGIVSATGFGGRAGVGGSSANVFNINWTLSGAQLWIDYVNVGIISVTSDYRVKKNIETQELPALERIAQLRPVKYEFTDYKELFKADGVQREGFIAHELQAVIPSAVEGEKDAEGQIQSLKLDALCSVMVKAIQEQQAMIEELKAKVSALEAK